MYKSLFAILLSCSFSYVFAASPNAGGVDKLASDVSTLQTDVIDLQLADEALATTDTELALAIESIPSEGGGGGCINGTDFVVSLDGVTKLTCPLLVDWGVNLSTKIACEYQTDTCAADLHISVNPIPDCPMCMAFVSVAGTGTIKNPDYPEFPPEVLPLIVPKVVSLSQLVDGFDFKVEDPDGNSYPPIACSVGLGYAMMGGADSVTFLVETPSGWFAVKLAREKIGYGVYFKPISPVYSGTQPVYPCAPPAPPPP
jgi:hypothetical protein